MAGQNTYKTIFKSTFLFGFVQIYNIIVKVLLNKIAAIILGPSGIGVLGLYNNSVNLLKTGCGLGIPQSAVRDISEANGNKNDNKQLNKTINITQKTVVYTSIISIIVTIALAPLLSKWTFDSYDQTKGYMIISFAVGLNVLVDGKLSVLKGLRRLKDLARASMIGSSLGLIIAVPFYYFLGIEGIPFSLITLAAGSYIVTAFFLSKLDIKKDSYKFKEYFRSAKGMIKMGCALMIVSFIGLLFDLAVASYISHNGGLSDVGYYQAGVTIISSYFGIVITAMSTDYYPRIAAINTDNVALQNEMNKQSEVGLILVFPLVAIFIVLSSTFIKILYDSAFEISNQYTNYALIGTIIIIVSNSMGMILLAKQASSTFLWSVLSQRLFLIGIYFFAYNKLGLLGLGLAYIFTGVIHLLFMIIILGKKYNIKLSKRTVNLLIIVIGTSLLMIYVRTIPIIYLKLILQTLSIVSIITFTVIYAKSQLGIDFTKIIKNRINEKISK